MTATEQGYWEVPKQNERAFYDYTNQAWVLLGKYIRCGHPEAMNCQCYGKMHHGEQADMDRIIKENQ